MTLAGRTLRLSTSVGLAWSRQEADPEELLCRAEGWSPRGLPFG